jgi:O-antigen/teichoic acid export membrane protein
LRANLRRYLALTVAYGAERALLLAAILTPTLLGAEDADLGKLELLLVAGTLGAALGPLGTENAIMHKRFVGIRANWAYAMLVGAGGGALISGILSVQFGLEGVVFGGLLGATLAMTRVTRARLRVADDTGPLIKSAWFQILAFAAFVAILHQLGIAVVGGIPLVVTAASVIALAPAISVARQDTPNQRAAARPMLRFGIPMALAAAGIWVVAASDRYMLAILEDVDTVGRYGVIYRTVMVFSGVMSTLVFWWRSEAYRRGEEWTRQALPKYMRGAGGAALAGSALLWWPITALLASILDLQKDEVGPVVAWLLLAIVGFVLLAGMVAPFATAERVRPVGLAWTVAAVSNVSLNLFLIPRHGIAGAAVATAAAHFLGLSVLLALYAKLNRQEHPVQR